MSARHEHPARRRRARLDGVEFGGEGDGEEAVGAQGPQGVGEFLVGAAAGRRVPRRRSSTVARGGRPSRRAAARRPAAVRRARRPGWAARRQGEGGDRDATAWRGMVGSLGCLKLESVRETAFDSREGATLPLRSRRSLVSTVCRRRLILLRRRGDAATQRAAATSRAGAALRVQARRDRRKVVDPEHDATVKSKIGLTKA